MAVITCFTNYLTNKLLNLYFTGGTLWLALYTTAPLPGIPFNAGVEMAGNGYARTPVVFGAPFIDRAGNLKVSNSAPVVFPVPTGPWGPLMSVCVTDASTAGNQYTYATIRLNGTIVSPSFNAGDIAMTFPVGSIQILFNSFVGQETTGIDSEDGIMNYLALKIVTENFVGASVYMGLLTAGASPSTSGTEVVDATYARQLVTWLPAQINPFSGAVTGNSTNIVFPNMTSGHTIIGTGLYDGISGGNLLLFNNQLRLFGAVTPAVIAPGSGLTFSSMSAGDLNTDFSHLELAVAL